MRFDILTIFPNFFGSVPTDATEAQGILGHGVVSRALRTHLASAHIHDLRAFTHDRHRTVDDRPFGGGEGMVLKPQPIHEALESLALIPKPNREAALAAGQQKETVILLSAQGKRFTQSTARRLATLNRVVLLCGRYEGVDERVSQLFCDEELSIGDYVLSGGELAAAILLDATVRLLPGVLGHADSSRYESFGEGDEPNAAEYPDQPNTGGYPDHPNAAEYPDQPNTAGYPEASASGLIANQKKGALAPPRSTNSSNGLLDYPHYTRPADFLGLSIPDVLANGDHLAIRRWRRQAALAKTLANRPDLLPNADLSDDDREYLATLGYTPEP
ncbi:MAG: tRNA (guanine(37)-N(1))-methyltransferase [Acidobacteriaceae bacterium]